jgi:hypothetical protein
VYEKSSFDGYGQEKPERRWFSGWGIFELKIESISLAKALRADSHFELNHLVIGPQLFLVGPGGGNGVVMGKKGNECPDIVIHHVRDLGGFSFLPLNVIVARHGLTMVGGFSRS